MNDLEKLAQDFFKQDAATVAKQLLGKKIIRKFDNGAEVEGRITEVSAWEGTYGDQQKHKFDEYEQGTLSVSCKFGKYLMDITCGNGRSCVTLINGEFDFDGNKTEVEGPGNFSKALNITPVFDGYLLNSNDSLKISGDSATPEEVKQRNKSNVPPNCRGYYFVK
jgi:DNA-3-methyladenine glycosylase